MSGRHAPRLCRICQAPLARKGHRCWRCGTHRPPPAGQRARLRALAGSLYAADAPDETVARAVAGRPPLPPSEAPDEPERWLIEATAAAAAKTPRLRLLR